MSPDPRPAAFRWGRWIAANATVFAAAACIMAVEILSTRLVARYLGSSLYTWTSAIGVVLAGISLGNYLGGRLADVREPRRALAVLFLASSLACMTIPALNAWLGQWPALDGLSWPTRILLHFVLVFLVPSTLLGTMSPVVAKMALGLGLGQGRTVGTIYAWGSIGSILGTFASGFWLVAWMGTERAILVIAGALALLGVLYGWRALWPWAWGGGQGVALLCVLGPWPWSHALADAFGLEDPAAGEIVFQRDSPYQRVLVLDEGGGRRTLQLDAMAHSLVDLDDPLALRYDYEAIYAEVLDVAAPPGAPVTALLIGGGGYVFPRYLELTRPGSYLEVAEIDPVVREAAQAAFGLPRDAGLRLFDLDARNRVADLARTGREGGAVPPFDVVFGDAFRDFSVPFHLTTLEFDRALAGLMGEAGVYALNLIDVLESGRFLGAVVRTCREVFPHVQVFDAGVAPDAQSTFVVVASKQPLDLSGVSAAALERHGVACRLLSAATLDGVVARAGDLVLTDDHAPVEHLLAEVYRRHRRPRAAARPDPALAQLELAARHTRRGEVEAAVRALEAALELDPRRADARRELGLALFRAGRPADAAARFREALREAPDDAALHDLLGSCLAATGDVEAAAPLFERAVELDPSSALYRARLALALERLGRRAEAARRYRESLERDPDAPLVLNALARLLASAPDAAARDGAEAVRLAERLQSLTGPDNPDALDTLALAHAEAGRFAEAVAAARRALELVEARGLHERAAALRQRLALFESGQPYRGPR